MTSVLKEKSPSSLICVKSVGPIGFFHFFHRGKAREVKIDERSQAALVHPRWHCLGFQLHIVLRKTVRATSKCLFTFCMKLRNNFCSSFLMLLVLNHQITVAKSLFKRSMSTRWWRFLLILPMFFSNPSSQHWPHSHFKSSFCGEMSSAAGWFCCHNGGVHKKKKRWKTFLIKPKTLLTSSNPIFPLSRRQTASQCAAAKVISRTMLRNTPTAPTMQHAQSWATG